MTRLLPSIVIGLVALAMPLAAQAQTPRPVLVYEPETDPVLLDAPHVMPDAPSDEDAVRAAVLTLFDGMRAADTSMVASVFHPNMTLQSVMPVGEGFQIQRGSAEGFLSALAQPSDAPWDEHIGPIAVQIDDGLAHAWMRYEFHLGDQYSHCGVNSMQLVKTDGRWQILNVVDTRRRECEPLE